MGRALRLAERALGICNPNLAVGAVLVKDGRIVGEGWTQPPGQAHAEIAALRQAGEAARGATLYVTLEPCLMCVGACLQARVAELVFGASDEKAGAVVSRGRLLDEPIGTHRVQVTGGVLAGEARALVQAFFRTRRAEGYRSGRTGLDSKSSWG